MIIDLILDRRDGADFDPAVFADEIRDYAEVFDFAGAILQALAGGVEQRVKFELCSYVFAGGYSPEICDFINSVDWLPAWWDREN